MKRSNPIIGDPVADSAVLLRRLAFFLLFLILPIGSVIGRRTLVIVVPIAIMLLAGAAILDGQHKPILPSLKKIIISPAFLLGFLFFGWCALSLLWSPFAETGRDRLVGLVTTIVFIFAGYLSLPERMRSSNLYLLPLGIGVAAVLALGIELLAGSANWRPKIEDVLQRGLLVLVLLFWPALAWLRSRQRDAAAVALLFLLFAALIVAQNKATLFVFAFGFIGYIACKLAMRTAPRIIAVITAGLLACAPVLPFLLQPFASLLSNEAFSASLATSRNLILSAPMQVISGQGFSAVNQARLTGILNFHAPNSMLFQFWYELGIVGSWSAAALIFIVISKAEQKYGSLTPGIIGSFISAYVFALLGIGAGQGWWTTALACTILVFIALARGQFRTQRPRVFFMNR